jgi:hypothetical protein
MKWITSLLLFIVISTCHGQAKITPTDELIISGQIQNEIKYTLTDLAKLEPFPIGDVAITNHLGEIKGTASNLSGIPIKALLDKIRFTDQNPKELSAYYFVFVASDNYKVVYSWNEIFNTPTGDNIFLVVSKDGKKLAKMDDRILILTKSDFKTGRRYIKGLSRIIIQKAP